MAVRVSYPSVLDHTPEDYALLAEAPRVLGIHDELDPWAIYAASKPPAVPPAALTEERFPLTLMPVESFPKIAEFWGTMGDKHRRKPLVHAVITVPLHKAPVWTGTMVFTTRIDTMLRDHPQSAETFVHIGGTLRESGLANATAVQGATLELLTKSGQRRQVARTDRDGRFVFAQVTPGDYRFRYSAQDLGSMITRSSWSLRRAVGTTCISDFRLPPRQRKGRLMGTFKTPNVCIGGEKLRTNLDVPSLTGEYNVRFP